MKKLLYLLIAVLCLSSGYDAYSQMHRRNIKKNNKRIASYRGRKSVFGKEKRYNAAGFGLSALNYYGDLAPRPDRVSTDISFTRPAISFSFTHRFGPRYSLVASFMYGTLKGSDVESADPTDEKSGFFRFQRNLSFRNRIKELSVVACFDLFENQATYISRVQWTPYAFLGFSIFTNNPKAQVPAYHVDGVTPFENAGEWVALQPLGTEGQYADLLPTDENYGIKKYHKIQPAIPFGIGARFRVNEVIDIAAEIGFRYTFTDYIDDVSRSYVDLGVFGDNELAKALSYRTNELFDMTLPDITTSFLTGYPGRDNPDQTTNKYFVLSGYGSEFRDLEGNSNIRGNVNDRDIYMVTTVRVTYILGKNFHRAKFR